jgi:hypothetical protein
VTRDQPAIVISRRGLRWLFIVLGLFILVLLGMVAARQNLIRLPDLRAASVADGIDRNAYQAVFLTGGQVFFGKADATNSGYVSLSDVFYLSTATEQTASQLIKRGSELHGPAEPMVIPMASVLFIENLRSNSDVVTAIAKFHAGQLPLATAPATGAPTTAPTTRPSASPSATR